MVMRFISASPAMVGAVTADNAEPAPAEKITENCLGTNR